MPTADSVVVDLIANVSKASADIKGYASTFEQASGRIEGAATRSDAAVKKSADLVSLNSARSANATRNLGRQIADVGTQLAGGQSPFLILAQQAPQIADALADTGGKAARFAAFFAGPWGAALLAAASIAGVFASSLLEGDKAAKKQKDSLEKLNEAIAEFQRVNGEAVSSEYIKIRLLELGTKAIVAQEVATRKNIKAQLEAAQAVAQTTNLGGAIAGGLGGPGANSGTATVLRLQAQLKAQDARIANAERNARVAAGNSTVQNIAANGSGADPIAASAARVTAANQRYELVMYQLERRLAAGTITQDAFNAATLRATRSRDQVVNSDKNQRQDDAAARKAEAAARKAESDRVRGVRDNEAFESDLSSLNQQLIEARKSQSTDAATLAKYERDRVIEEGKKRAQQIKADVDAKKYTAPEGAKLLGINTNVVAERTKAINDALAESQRRDAQSIATADIKNQRELLSAQSALNDTTSSRRDSALRLLDLQYQMEKIELEGIKASTTATEAQKKIAQARLDALPDLQKADAAVVGRQNERSSASYLRSLNPTEGERADIIDDQAVRHLQDFNTELDNSVKKALGLHGIFGDIVGDLIDMAIKQALIKPIANALFGGASGGGGVLASLGGLFGRASGGYVPGGQMIRVNEGAAPGKVEGFVPLGSGNVIPLGRMQAAQSGAGTSMTSIAVSVDARNAADPVMTARLVEQGIRMAAPVLIAESQSRTINSLRKPSLPGSAG